MNENVLWDLKADKVNELAKQDKRVDQRALDEYREIKITKNISENAEGSANVKLGKSEVVAGVKMILGTPYPDSPDKGTISVGTELLPLASADFELGPPRPQAIELARVVDRGIRESKTIDFKDLCITEGEQVWVCFIDMYVLNDDGNLFDALNIAALTSLLESKIPKVEDEKIVKGEFTGKLKLSRKPILSTFAKVGNKIFADPSLAEEKAQTARFSVSTSEDDYLCAFQKGISGGFSGDEIDHCMDLAFKSSKEIRKQL